MQASAKRRRTLETDWVCSGYVEGTCSPSPRVPNLSERDAGHAARGNVVIGKQAERARWSRCRHRMRDSQERLDTIFDDFVRPSAAPRLGGHLERCRAADERSPSRARSASAAPSRSAFAHKARRRNSPRLKANRREERSGMSRGQPDARLLLAEPRLFSCLG